MDNQINIGDKVTWAKTSQRGHTISMRQLDGVVVAISGNEATVERNGKRYEKAVSSLRRVGQKGQITEFVEAMIGRGGR